MAGRPVQRVHATPDFTKSFRSLPSNIQHLFERKEQRFLANAFDPALRTHKLTGPLKKYWAFSLNRHYRVLFGWLSDYEVIYYDVGTYEIYR